MERWGKEVGEGEGEGEGEGNSMVLKRWGKGGILNFFFLIFIVDYKLGGVDFLLISCNILTRGKWLVYGAKNNN